MDIVLRGSSPCATVAGILLITRARQLGMRLRASIVGDADDMTVLRGPVVVTSPVLASCGIGRDLGNGAVIVVRGAPGEPLLVSLDPEGTSAWFQLDRYGRGVHPATEAYLRLSRDARVPGRKIAKDLRRGMELLGMASDPAVLDLLFGAPVPPLSRLNLALRAGRAISGLRGEPITRFLSGHVPESRDPLPPTFDAQQFAAALKNGDLAWILDGLAANIRDQGEEWLDAASTLAGEDSGRDLRLIYGLAEVASHLVQLPPHSMLPPLPAHEDGVATAIKAALSADGDEDANAQLRTMFQFLGGKYVASAEHAFDVDSTPPPEAPIDRWRWFCEQAVLGRRWADELWPNVVDPPQ